MISVQTEVENDEGLDIKVEVYEYKKGFDTTGKVKSLKQKKYQYVQGKEGTVILRFRMPVYGMMSIRICIRFVCS